MPEKLEQLFIIINPIWIFVVEIYFQKLSGVVTKIIIILVVLIIYPISIGTFIDLVKQIIELGDIIFKVATALM